MVSAVASTVTSFLTSMGFASALAAAAASLEVRLAEETLVSGDARPMWERVLARGLDGVSNSRDMVDKKWVVVKLRYRETGRLLVLDGSKTIRKPDDGRARCIYTQDDGPLHALERGKTDASRVQCANDQASFHPLATRGRLFDRGARSISRDKRGQPL